MRFEKGWYSPKGWPAYLVIDSTAPDQPTGIVWRAGRRRGQRDGDWSFEPDGFWKLPWSQTWHMTRQAAAAALLKRIGVTNPPTCENCTEGGPSMPCSGRKACHGFLNGCNCLNCLVQARNESAYA